MSEYNHSVKRLSDAVYRYAAAAVLLLAAVTSIVLIRTSPQPAETYVAEQQVQKSRNYSDVMPFKLDARLTLGWKWGSIYFQPSLLPVFKSGDDWDVVPMRVGLRFF